MGFFGEEQSRLIVSFCLKLTCSDPQTESESNVETAFPSQSTEKQRMSALSPNTGKTKLAELDSLLVGFSWNTRGL